MTTQQLAQKIAAYLSDKPVIRAYLFGSYARGEERPESDVDVLVELDYANGGADFSRYLDMMEDLSTIAGRKVDLVSAKGLSKHIAPYIHQDKRLIYERKAG